MIPGSLDDGQLVDWRKPLQSLAKIFYLWLALP